MVNVKKVHFEVEFGALKAIFPPKSLNFFGFLNFKAPKVPLITRMRVYSEKQSCSSIKNLPFCFSDHARIRQNKGTFGALKLKNPRKIAIFGANLPFWALSPHQNPFF